MFYYKILPTTILEEPKEITFDSSGGDMLITPLNEIDKWIDEVSKLL